MYIMSKLNDVQRKIQIIIIFKVLGFACTVFDVGLFGVEKLPYGSHGNAFKIF